MRLVSAARGQRRRCVSAKTAFSVSSRLTVTDQEDDRSKGHLPVYYCFYLCGDGFSFQLLRLVMRHKRIDEGVEVALHHEIELMNR